MANDDKVRLLWRYLEKVYPSKEYFEKLLHSGRKLKVYLGIDPTGPRLHLGHSVGLLALRQIQKMGHRVVLLVGDFTARIGDPSGKTNERVPLSATQVRQNTKTYKTQAAHLLDFAHHNPVTLEYNGRWLGKMTLAHFVGVLKNFTVSQLLERDLFQRRIKERKPIALNEFLYPLFQGYDSVALNVDGEVGGTDQTFNMLAGRQLLKLYKNREKFVLAVKLLDDPVTGKKMSKSEGTAVWLDQLAEQMFGQVMSLPDGFIAPCLRLCTELADSEIAAVEKLAPREAKLHLASEIVGLYHGERKAVAAQAAFERVFVQKQAPAQAPTVKIKAGSCDLPTILVQAKAALSKSEARRLIEQGAVEIAGKVVRDWRRKLPRDGKVLFKVGKRRFFKVIAE